MKLPNDFLTGNPLSSKFQQELEKERCDYFENGVGNTSEKLSSLTRFMSRQNIAKLLCYAEFLKTTKDVVGSIFECGVYYGNGFMAYATLSAALEPYNYPCKIVGFDTFEGDKGIGEKDMNPYVKREEGDFCGPVFEDLQRAITIFDKDRPLNHIKKLELVKGDIRETAKEYLNNNPQLAIRILHLSMNVYEPTKAALNTFLPRVSKGGIVSILGINMGAAGATLALIEEVGNLSGIKLKTFDFYPNMCYFIVE